ncbi:MAG: hypothetical protein Q7S75_02510 [bacterium]|nr:hypothetical protein [bacterium]
MDTNNQENNPMNNQGAVPGNQPVEPSSSSTGPFVGAIIIILLLALGAFYFWNYKLDTINNNPPPLILGNDTASADPSSDAGAGLPAQQTSDEAAAIEADLQAMNIDQFNAQTDANLQGFQQSAQ